MSKYFSEQSKIHKEATEKAYRSYRQKQTELDQEAVRKQRQKYQEDAVRKFANFQQELEINLDEAYRQLGKSRPKAIPPGRIDQALTPSGA